MKTIILLGTICFSITTMASEMKLLGKEANAALRHLSFCASNINQIVNDGAWIGKTEKWDAESGNYGYTFTVVRKNLENFSVENVGTLELTAEFNNNPMADESLYNYSCDIRK